MLAGEFALKHQNQMNAQELNRYIEGGLMALQIIDKSLLPEKDYFTHKDIIQIARDVNEA